MVKFGERMIAMQHLGWEQHYIKYDDLKVTISKLDACSTDAEYKAVSDAFCAELTRALEHVDSFVLAETKSLRAALDPNDAASLRKVHSSVKVLRRFVGTNVIAATKISKKHDKHVQPALSKRLVIGNMIRGSQAFSQLIAFSAEVDAKSPKATKEVYTEEEQGLRSLPDWLLSGASADKEGNAGSEASDVESMHGQFRSGRPHYCHRPCPQPRSPLAGSPRRRVVAATPSSSPCTWRTGGSRPAACLREISCSRTRASRSTRRPSRMTGTWTSAPMASGSSRRRSASGSL